MQWIALVIIVQTLLYFVESSVSFYIHFKIKMIRTNILYYIDSSSKVLRIWSDFFLESQWAKVEIRRALWSNWVILNTQQINQSIDQSTKWLYHFNELNLNKHQCYHYSVLLTFPIKFFQIIFIFFSLYSMNKRFVFFIQLRF